MAVLDSPLGGLEVTEGGLETSEDGGVVMGSLSVEELGQGKVSVGESRGVWVVVPLGNLVGDWDESGLTTWEDGESQLWVGLVEDLLGSLIKEPVLGFILEDLLLNEDIEWRWTIVDSGEDEIVLDILTGERVEVHAHIWLHGGGHWLGEESGSLWHLVALLDGDIEIDVRVEWDWLSTNWGPGEGVAVGKVVWAVEEGSGSLGQLWDGEIPTFPDLGGTKGENLSSSIGLVGEVSNNGTILEVSLPGNGGPGTKGTLLRSSGLFDIDSNS